MARRRNRNSPVVSIQANNDNAPERIKFPDLMLMTAQVYSKPAPARRALYLEMPIVAPNLHNYVIARAIVGQRNVTSGTWVPSLDQLDQCGFAHRSNPGSLGQVQSAVYLPHRQQRRSVGNIQGGGKCEGVFGEVQGFAYEHVGVRQPSR